MYRVNLREEVKIRDKRQELSNKNRQDNVISEEDVIRCDKTEGIRVEDKD